MRLAYFWPAWISALRATLMILVVGIPVVLFLTIPLEAATGSGLLVGVVGLIFAIVYTICVLVEKWKEGGYNRRRKRRDKRAAKEEQPPSWFFQLFQRGYRNLCPLIQFEDD
jgi:hypothetical protein